MLKLACLPDGSPEIFRTLQGEGPSIGCPATFLRLSLCNLHCIWCDTPHTWNWKSTPWPHVENQKFDRNQEILSLEIDAVINALEPFATERLVITGGEPLLQQKALLPLLGQLSDSFKFFEIETNGTQTPVPALDTKITQYNVSPKLSNSAQEKEIRIIPKALEFFSQSPKATFKFVVSNETDLEEILILQQQFKIPSGKILLMPEGTCSKQLAERRPWLAEQCIQNGFRLGDRLHVHLWGHTRGT